MLTDRPQTVSAAGAADRQCSRDDQDKSAGVFHGLVCLVPSHNSDAWGRGKVAASPGFALCNTRSGSGLAAIFDRDIQRWGCSGLLLWRRLADHRAHVLKQHRHSLQLALAQCLMHCCKAQCLDLV
jgi:hypothetical protein